MIFKLFDNGGAVVPEVIFGLVDSVVCSFVVNGIITLVVPEPVLLDVLVVVVPAVTILDVSGPPALPVVLVVVEVTNADPSDFLLQSIYFSFVQ